MPADLAEIILYLVQHAKHPPTKTSLMKLIYFADYRSYQLYGVPLSDCTWEADQYGPADYHILNLAWELWGEEKLQVEPTHYRGSLVLRYHKMPRFTPEYPTLFPMQKALLDWVVGTYGHYTASALAKQTKKTEPWKAHPDIELRERLDMSRIKRVWDVSQFPEVQQLAKLLEPLDLSERGTPEERSAHRHAVWESLEQARKRATTAVLQSHDAS